MNNLRSLREKTGLTQEQVAKDLSVTQGAVSQWERGETFPQTKFLVALAKLYGCTVDEILN